MAIQNFFRFSDVRQEGNSIKTNIELYPEHPIFEGHFPGLPVLPGVCMMQMVKEVVENHLNMQTRLVKASDLKFLSVIRPDHNKFIQMELKVSMEDESVRVDAQLLDGAAILFKFKGTFIER
jgi:3-hydroxyacyl-[acyl-carrier-protein] dehydratase